MRFDRPETGLSCTGCEREGDQVSRPGVRRFVVGPKRWMGAGGRLDHFIDRSLSIYPVRTANGSTEREAR